MKNNEVGTSPNSLPGHFHPGSSQRTLLVRTPDPEHGDKIEEMTEDQIRIEVEDGEMLIDEETDELVQKDEIPEKTKRVRREKRVGGG